MKKSILLGFTILFTNIGLSQDISQNQVPSIIVNQFQQKFPKAFDIEWEKKNDLYKVSFETTISNNNDQTAYYNQSGELTKHIKEGKKSDLPSSVTSEINKNYNGFWVEDVKIIVEGKNTKYQVEVKSLRQEWLITYDQNGKELNKLND